MEKDTLKDTDVLNRLWELARIDKVPTVAQEQEFSELQCEMTQRLQRSLEIEKKTRRLLQYLKAA